MKFGKKLGAFDKKLKSDLQFNSIIPHLTLFSLVTIIFRNIPDDFLLQSASVKMFLYVAILGLISIVTLPQIKMGLRAPSILLISLFGLQYLFTLDSSFLLRGSSERTEMYQDEFYWLLLILIAISLIAYARLLHKQIKDKELFQRWKAVIYIFFVLGLSIHYSSFLPISTDHPYLSNSNDTMVVFNPIIQTSLGKAVNFNIYSFYGDYALILSPFFKFVSPNVENITLVLGIINFVSLVLYGRIIALANFSALPSVCYFMLGIFLQYHAFTIWPADKYYQVYPIRMLFPIVIIWLILDILPRRPMVFFLISPVISALAIIWNFETGVVCLLSLLVANILCKSLNLKAIQRFTFFLLTLSSSLTIYLLLGYFKTGNAFQIKLFTKPFGIWYVKLESIRWNGFWLMVLIFYLLALATIVKDHKRGKDSSSYIACLVMSIGLLFYHLLNYIQHESTLSNVAWPIPIVLLIVLRFWADARNEVDFWRHFKSAVLMLMPLAFGIASLTYVNFNGYISIEPKDYEIRDKTKVRELYRTFLPERGAFYITNVEQANGQLSPWQRRLNLARDLKSKESSAQNTLFISNYDSLMYQAYGKPAYFDWSNWYHAYRLEKDETFDEVVTALSLGELDLVVIDNSPDCLDLNADFSEFLRISMALKENYVNSGSVFGGFMYDSSSGHFVRSMISIWKVVDKKTSKL